MATCPYPREFGRPVRRLKPFPQHVWRHFDFVEAHVL